jgi:hypothetical protein
MRPFNPASIRTVALCEKDDSVLRPLAEQHGIEVEIDDPHRIAERSGTWTTPPGR